jgi:hypothetical protein
MKLYGQNWSKREIEAMVGKMDQIGGISRLQHVEGREAGTELIQVKTGSGLTYYISPSRGFDIVQAEFGGSPLSWTSPNGRIHPSYFQEKGKGWLKTAAGGLLMTCGLTQVGSSCIDGDEELGLHGAIHHIPAKNTSTTAQWLEDDYVLKATGVMEETSMFGYHLELKREITSYIGENRIIIKDIVENKGFHRAPHMILYHFNFGFPLMSEKTKLTFPSNRVIARDPETSIEHFDRWEKPVDKCLEKVYYHEQLNHDSRKVARVLIKNPAFPVVNGTQGLTASLSWETKHLPKLVQWKMNEKGMNVLGIEPSNCLVEGRVKERERGTLLYLEPGEQIEYNLEFSIQLS